ncbi:CD209 antigen-like protein E isoform X2 [Xenopus laevis]|uniref:CD209 antigen-like protein E isoform X2 n=1 Tax=Xenopus laevis TaxID=8355 RepID=A0A8J1MPY4_XENLA|nr:CD209 antigen-like protein E isoform X2 [Xenopus laevis]
MNKGKHQSQAEDNIYEDDYITEPTEPSVRIETHGIQEKFLSKYFNPGEKFMAQKTLLFVLVILFILVFIFLIILTSLVSIYYSVITSQLKQSDEAKAELVSQMRIINQTFEQTCRRCPSGWRMVNSFCYYFSTTPQTWEEAKTSCANANSSLLTVEDEAEMVRCSFHLESSDVNYWFEAVLDRHVSYNSRRK